MKRKRISARGGGKPAPTAPHSTPDAFYTGALVLRKSAEQYGARELWLGAIKLSLTLREFVLLKVLATLAVSDYLAMAGLLDAISEAGRHYTWNGRDLWSAASEANAYRVVSNIRQGLKEQGFEDCLIETSPRRDGGYKLHASRIVLDFLPDVTSPEQR
ncbi:MAG: hypothetical protein KJ726_10460 [Verrucomicrobia bacterium]|nr:hypothetical protein [Verrucomicrobiota bacterium]MBU1910457.1 hypothetical protein [Verrucomicrobiota bacterium]